MKLSNFTHALKQNPTSVELGIRRFAKWLGIDHEQDIANVLNDLTERGHIDAPDSVWGVRPTGERGIFK